MNRLFIAIAVLAVAAMSFAARVQAHETGATGHPEMKKEMMANPQYLLMMGYHSNLMMFGHKLMKVAKQGETVPREFARVAVAEMRRSTEEMEKYRAEAMRNVPADVRAHDEMQKTMDQHLVNVKSHLRELEDLTRGDRIPSQEVIRHLEAMYEGCEGMDCGMMHGKGVHGRKGMHGCNGCQCPEMMPEHHTMMKEMLQKMKTEDAELNQKVQAMRDADPDRKFALLTDIVARMVRQRAEMTAQMERMQMEMPHHGAGGYIDDEDGDKNTPGHIPGHMQMQ
ncbi:MAG: hypothetical protein A2075_07120 [Geobacteraceae bacterium GWC2_58_44]|nr:MAG: hypothetical protein A2075_07120 [Geobacteraceae bacterium GWC2_58_44]HBG04498.1 hypothetical protein [Geobacter sp.]